MIRPARSKVPFSAAASGVPGAFDAGAHRYDQLVGANPGYHEHLRLSARRMGLPNAGAGLRLLDLGCGTGASTAALLDAAPHAEIVAVDASTQMLAQARLKTWPPGVRFIHARAEDLAHAGVTGPFDGVLAAYLVRNLPSPDAGLRDILDLLKPGAPLAVHEYSVRDSRRSRLIWTLVAWTVIIPYGRLRTGSGELYRYLWRSVRKFDGARALRERMNRAGFVDVRSQTMPGWQQGIVHTFLGRRPGAPGSAGSAGSADSPEV
jgi:ubiquinone/menaquinone biosynthesis C-methylase UbiE